MKTAWPVAPAVAARCVASWPSIAFRAFRQSLFALDLALYAGWVAKVSSTSESCSLAWDSSSRTRRRTSYDAKAEPSTLLKSGTFYFALTRNMKYLKIDKIIRVGYSLSPRDIKTVDQ